MQVQSLPRYRQLASELKTRIDSGFYDETGLLPRERDLESEFAVGRNTVRGALEVLCGQEIITKVQGKGSIINRFAQKNGEYIVLSYDIAYKSSYIIDMLHEIEKFTAANSDFVSYMQLSGDAQDEINSVIRRIKEHKNLKGLILLGGYTRKLLHRLALFTLPMVMIGDPRETNRINNPVVSQVVGDNYGMIYKTIDFLLKRKFRRIALLTPPESLIWGKAYIDGYQHAFHDNNIEFKQEYCCSLADHRDVPGKVAAEEEKQLKKIFNLNELPEVLIVNSSSYETAKKIAKENEIEIPKDIIIITGGSEDIPENVPYLITELSKIVSETFDLLKQEQKNNGSVKQRRAVEASFINSENIRAK